MLTLLQTGKRDIVPVVFLDEPGGQYWNGFQRFVEQEILGRRMIDPEDLSLYKLTDRVDEAVGEILRFFRVYHSMRYVRDNLVLRLTQRPDEELLDRINTRFADILAGGRFTVGGPLGEEKDQPELAKLPQLIFHFNHRNHGRLRQLIDCVNAGLENHRESQ